MTDYDIDELIELIDDLKFGAKGAGLVFDHDKLDAIAAILRESKNKDDHLHNVRRTAERGLGVCQGTETNMNPDIFQHMLDELERAGIKPPKQSGGEQ